MFSVKTFCSIIPSDTCICVLQKNNISVVDIQPSTLFTTVSKLCNKRNMCVYVYPCALEIEPLFIEPRVQKSPPKATEDVFYWASNPSEDHRALLTCACKLLCLSDRLKERWSRETGMATHTVKTGTM